MIDKTAIIDPTARLAANVKVGPYSIIGADVEIGAGSEIGPHVVIRGPTRIGCNNRFFQFSSIGEDPQDLKYEGGDSYLEIGDGNTFREFVTINRGTELGGGYTRIGSDNLFMAYAHVAHDCRIGSHTIFSNAASVAGHVEVGDHAILGGFSGVHQFCRIGQHAFSGMYSAINQDVPPYVIVAGNHAAAYGINKRGLRRRGFSEETISALHQGFKLLVKERGRREGFEQKLQLLTECYPEVEELQQFIQQSERGIVR